MHKTRRKQEAAHLIRARYVWNFTAQLLAPNLGVEHVRLRLFRSLRTEYWVGPWSSSLSLLRGGGGGVSQ